MSDGGTKPQTQATSPHNFTDLWCTSRDGLRLYGRRYGPQDAKGAPVLCLAGLTRNSRDFHTLAKALSAPAATDGARLVFTLDTRGRGQSDYDMQPANYTLATELQDVIDFLSFMDVGPVALIGTSRGGLLAHLLGAAMPTALKAVVLNDIGPVIEAEGLSRIASYVGRTPVPANWDDAAQVLERTSRAQFPRVSREQWTTLARQWFNEVEGKPAPGYDPGIATAFASGASALKPQAPAPTLWPQFTALSHVPVLSIRGANSDLFSAATQLEMKSRHPRCETLIVDEEGHAPLLMDAPTISAIGAFLARTDVAASG